MRPAKQSAHASSTPQGKPPCSQRTLLTPSTTPAIRKCKVPPTQKNIFYSLCNKPRTILNTHCIFKCLDQFLVKGEFLSLLGRTIKFQGISPQKSFIHTCLHYIYITGLGICSIKVAALLAHLVVMFSGSVMCQRHEATIQCAVCAPLSSSLLSLHKGTWHTTELAR